MARDLRVSDFHLRRLVLNGLYEVEKRLVRLDRFTDQIAEVTDVHTHEKTVVSINQLASNSSAVGLVAINKVSTEDWQAAVALDKFLRLLISLNVKSRAELDRLAREYGIAIKCRQLQRWKKRFIARPAVSTCLRNSRGRKKGGKVISRATEAAIQFAVLKAKGIKEVITLERLFKLVQEECEKSGAKLPSKTTLKARLKVAGIQLGKRRARGPTIDETNGVVHGGENKVDQPLGQVQIDHTMVDLMVFDETALIFLGRPWLTLVIDVRTRVILGFYLSMMAPGIHAVSRALLMAALPKDELLKRMGIYLDWEAYGKIQSVLTDNAAEFKCDAFIRGCEEEGINPRLRPLGKKHWGGHIERLIGTMMGQIHLLPGTTFRNPKVRGEYDSKKEACLTLPELSKWIVLNIIKYNNKVHSDLDESPNRKWQSEWARLGGQKAEHKVLDEKKFYFSFLEKIQGKVQKDGIHWGTKVYHAPYMDSLRVGTPFEAGVDRKNTRSIFIQTPDGDFIVLPRRTSATYDDFDLENAHRKAKRDRSNDGYAREQIAGAEKGQDEILATAKMRRDAKRRARRVDAVPLETPLKDPPPPQTPALLAPTEPADGKPRLGTGGFVVPARVRAVTTF